MRRRDANSARTAWLVVAGLVVFMLVLAGCGSSSSDGSSSEELQKVGKGEGSLNLISWAGYVEPEWTKPFEAKTGCKVSDKEAGTSDEMVELMKTGQYDGVSASGNATARLVAADLVDPVNVDLVPNYKTVFSDLKDQPYNTFDGVNYGIPHGRGANLLMWNSDDVKPAPDSWDIMFDPKMAAKYKGKISAYDESELHRRRRPLPQIPPARPGDRKPLRAERRTVRRGDQAARRTARQRRRILVGSGQADLRLRRRRRRGRHHLAVPVLRAARAKACRSRPAPPARASCPRRAPPAGRTPGCSAPQAKHPNCMYKWMNWIIEPKVNAEVAEYFGEAPAQELACEETANKNFCAEYHAEEPAFWKRVYYWETPLADCGNGEEDCMDYNDWVKAWTAIKG